MFFEPPADTSHPAQTRSCLLRSDSSFTAARQRIPALRVRSSRRKSGARKRRRAMWLSPDRRMIAWWAFIPDGRRAVPATVSGTAGQVWSGMTCGQDTTDRIRAVRRPRPETAREARDPYVFRFHPLMWGSSPPEPSSSGGLRRRSGWSRSSKPLRPSFNARGDQRWSSLSRHPVIGRFEFRISL